MYSENDRRRIIREVAFTFFNTADLEKLFRLNRKLTRLSIEVNRLAIWLEGSNQGIKEPPEVSSACRDKLMRLRNKRKKVTKLYHQESAKINESCRQKIAASAMDDGLRVFYSESAKEIIKSERLRKIREMIALSNQMSELRKAVSK